MYILSSCKCRLTPKYLCFICMTFKYNIHSGSGEDIFWTEKNRPQNIMEHIHTFHWCKFYVFMELN